MTAALGLSTVTLGVRDMDRARRYYATAFGPVDPPAAGAPCYLRLAGTWIALFPRQELARYFGLPENAAPQPGAFGGVTLSVNLALAEEVDALCERLRRAGGTVTVEPCAASWGGRIACITDPDGYPLELVWNPKRSAP